eukprot:360715-Chlamydomonas_euryale.AAC.3
MVGGYYNGIIGCHGPCRAVAPRLAPSPSAQQPPPRWLTSRSSEVGVERPHVIPHVVELILNFVAAVSPAPRQLHGLVGVQRPAGAQRVKAECGRKVWTQHKAGLSACVANTRQTHGARWLT